MTKESDSPILSPEIVKPLLDDYARQTAIPIGLYERDWGTFSALSKDVFSGFCSEFRKIKQCLDACEADHKDRALEYKSTRAIPQMCHAGLWNIGYPIIVGNDHVATLLCGQRLVEGQQQKSERRFIQRARELSLSEQDTSRLLDILRNKTGTISKAEFKTDIFRHLQQTGRYMYELAEGRIKLLRDKEAFEHRIIILTHEFLLPIQAIVADAANLVDETKERATCDLDYVQEAAKEILDEMNRLHTLTETMRSSFLIQRPVQVEYRIHSIYRPLIRCWETYNAEAISKGVTLRKPAALSGTFPNMEISLPSLERAFMNLIGNAVKYSYIGSSITDRYIDITCSHDRSFCTVVISNFGVGILPEEISAEKIFEPGYRGLLSKDRSRIGSGLGLSEAKRIIRELHHGTINVKSHDKLSGYKTSVTVVLPLRQLKGERE